MKATNDDLVTREELKGIADQFRRYLEIAKDLTFEGMIITWMQNPYSVLAEEDEEVRRVAGLIHITTQLLIKHGILNATLQPKYMKIGERGTEIIYCRQHNGYSINYHWDVIKQDVTKVDISDALRKMGITNLEHFLSTDEGLDIINQYQRDFPERPLFGENGLLKLYKGSM